ncbi:MAG: exodeoxyribonuclease VII large subunit [PVC group bacterium]
MNLEEQKGAVYTVSELTGRIKNLLEEQFVRIGVVGEISNLRRPPSGHLYFTLKDAGSQLPAVFFREDARRARCEMRDGLEVTAWGRITVYRPRGNYQLAVTALEPRGAGALQRALEQLKTRLAGEGLFDARWKKPLPALPSRIGIVTSPTGAAIRDILQVIRRRFGGIRIIINPVPVQGEGAAGEIARAIGEFNRWKNVDVIIVGRGGGSLEDLWAFNEEAVVRSIFASEIPVISAVGHEIDWTLSDLVADLRAPTPSAAAELVIARKSELLAGVEQLERRMERALEHLLGSLRGRVERALRSTILHDPRRLLRQSQQRLDELSARMNRLAGSRLRFRRQEVESLRNRLESLSPQAVLARGYSFTRRVEDGMIVTSAALLETGVLVETRLREGSFVSIVRETDYE